MFCDLQLLVYVRLSFLTPVYREKPYLDFKITVLGLTCLDCVIDITCGTTFTDRHKGFQSCICVRLTNKESLPIYAKSKEHLEVVELLKPHLKNIVAMDYESPRKPGKAAFWSTMPAHCAAGILVAGAAVLTALFVSKK